MRRGFAQLAARHRPVIGTWSQFADPDVIELLAVTGMDFTIIDCEHGAFGIETAAQLIRASEGAGITALVRAPRAGFLLAQQALDCGAAGIVAPGVETAKEAQAWVRATSFAPAGERGACPIVRAAGHSAYTWTDTLYRQSDNGLVVLIETELGVRNAESIAQTPGIRGVMVGPFDLSCSMGLAGEVQHPKVQAALNAVVAATRRHTLCAWMPLFSTDIETLSRDVASWQAKGVSHFPIGADKIFMQVALRQYIRAASPQ